MPPADARDDLRDRLSRETDAAERVLDAVRAVPRHEFVPDERADAAYADRPLPIGDDQTVSAPHIVAVMCDRLALRDADRVLEIGTGCGYHAAVTAELVGAENVFSVEYSESLAADARENLERTGYGEVSVRVGDGRDGWPDRAPYDAAYLTCAAPDFPVQVVSQVRDGGRLVAPLGDHRQTLTYAEKTETGLDRSRLSAVRFVRIRGE